MYQIDLREGLIDVTANGMPLLGGMYVTLRTQRLGECRLVADSMTTDGGHTVVNLVSERTETATLSFDEVGASLQCRIHVVTVRHGQRINFFLSSNDSLALHFAFAEGAEGNYITEKTTKLWFQVPQHNVELDKLPRQTSDLHVAMNGKHVHMLPLVSDDLRTEFYGNALVMSVGCGGVNEVEGAVMALTVGDDPFAVVEETFRAGRESGAIAVPLRHERTLPDMFHCFGWCTWDAFYQDVTAEKIYRKLTELKEKGVCVRYVLIDDGWSQVKDSMLWSFSEDKEKFPEGLAACVRRIKEEFGVTYVGVWQAYNGYWQGIHPDGEVAQSMRDCLLHAPNDLLLPAPDAEKSYAFWHAWHAYLEECGIDFVKVDNQATYSYYIDEACRNVAGVRGAHEGLERSVFEHFDGRLINCMGMGIYDLLTRPRSAVNRNSNDFLPKLENGFAIHAVTNVYNTLTHSQIMVCDYDMFWTRHESAKPSSVLRAISGGPVYISDPIDATDEQYVRPLYEGEGMVPVLDGQAMPTYDCFYRSCEKDGIPLKVWNRKGENFAVAAFGLTDAGACGSLRLADIPGASGRYVAIEYFSGRAVVMDEHTELAISLPKLDVELWNLYPVRDGHAVVADSTLYMGCAAKNTKVITV